VADLRIEDAALIQAQATLRTAGNHLAPVVQRLRGLDTEVVGVGPLIGQLQNSQELLGADLGIVGQALAQLAAHAATLNAAFTQSDQQLSQVAKAAN
jgi:hypothetical protein